jgi:outer membrane protein assembly factor BamB
MAWLPSHLSDTEMTFAFDETAAPFVGARHWLRLTVGSGVAKCWTSGDGRLWSQAIYAPSPVLGGIHRAGLYVLPGAADRAVGLRTFEVRRFERLMALAPEALLQHPSAALDATAGLDELRRRAVKSRPADADPAVWQRACLLRTLAENPSPSLAAPLLHQLVEEAIAAEGDPAAQFQLLDEAAAVANNNDLATVRAFTAYYERVGRAMRRGGQAGTLDAVGASLLRSPLWGYERQACWPAELLRYEMLDLAMRDGWQPAAAALERLDFWTRPDRLETRKPPWDPATEHLVEWARFETARRRAAPTEPPPVPLVFRPRWIERIDRESFNVASEIRSALQARAFPEAAQTIAASARPDLPGLLPDADDPRLWLSLPTALSRAMQQSPELLEAMRTELGARGKLRLTRAVAVGDTAAAESIALQFLGAEAAGEALAWLGDRALSAGRPGPAARYYRRGLAWLPEAARADAAARLRLAAAMLGEQAGQPVQAAVHVGDLQLTAAEFEKLVREVRHAAGGDNGGPDDARLPFDPAAAPPALEAKKWARLDGGDLPRPAGVSDNSFDWAALQVALASAGDKLLVATPTTLAAYQTSDGKKAWSAQAKGGETQTATGPMQPLVRGGRIYVRWPAEGGAALRCLDADNGREVWTVRPAGHVISDPLWAEDALFALALGRELTQPAQVWLCKCDPASGQVLRETPAAEFRHDGGSRVSCRATAAGERLIASLWGCVLCCDLEGRAVWARQQVYVPPPASPPAVTNFWARQRHGPPCVQGQRIFVAQPGVWSVECLDVETGTLVWRQPLPELIGVTGVAGGRVIVETADGPAALDAESGRLLWRSGWPDPLDGRWLCGAGGVLLAASREPADGQLKRRLRVHGMDLASGKLLGGADLAGVRGEAALLGPIASFGGRLWACKAAADDPAQRDLVELRPATP